MEIVGRHNCVPGSGLEEKSIAPNNPRANLVRSTCYLAAARASSRPSHAAPNVYSLALRGATSMFQRNQAQQHGRELSMLPVVIGWTANDGVAQVVHSPVRPQTNAGGEDEQCCAGPREAVDAHRAVQVSDEVYAEEGHEDGKAEIEKLTAAIIQAC